MLGVFHFCTLQAKFQIVGNWNNLSCTGSCKQLTSRSSIMLSQCCPYVDANGANQASSLPPGTWISALLLKWICETPIPSCEYRSSSLYTPHCATQYSVSFDYKWLPYQQDVRHLCTCTSMLHVGCTQQVFMASLSTTMYMSPVSEIW